MPQQMSLFEEPEREPDSDPLFFALLPDADAAARIADLVERFRASHGLTGALRPLHITLCDLILRETTQRTLEVASRVAASVVGAPFRVSLHRVMRFGGGRNARKDKRPFVLAGDDGVAGLTQFRQSLCLELRKANLTKWSANFTPHLTLLYDNPLPDDQDVLPIAWTVQEFVLIRSLVGQTTHEILGRWPLHV
jgi:RNA 2',3'-cyclic 3'-phosphodiesterase